MAIDVWINREYHHTPCIVKERNLAGLSLQSKTKEHTMTWDDLLACLRQPESMELRFFKKDPDPESLCIVMAAMANADGGTIIVGIDHKNLHFFGSLMTDDALKAVVRQHCRAQFRITTSIIPRGGKSIASIQVHESTQKPVFFDDACYVYMGEGSRFFIAQDPFAVLSIDPSDMVSVPVMVDPILGASDTRPERVPELVASEQASRHIEIGTSIQTPLFETLNERQRQAVVFMQNNPAIRNQVYREMFGISHKTAHIELTELVNSGVFVQAGAGRSTHYVLATYTHSKTHSPMQGSVPQG